MRDAGTVEESVRAAAEAGSPGSPDEAAVAADAVRVSRRRFALDGLAMIASSGGFGLVYGLSARAAGFSPLEAGAMSVLVFAGASQFAAVGYVLGGFSWIGVVILTAFINARHVPYSAALSPFLTRRSPIERAVMAHVLTDEAFALSIAHFRRIGRADIPGYWYAALVTTFIPWNVATIAGVLIGGQIPDPSRYGLDVVFPAAMAGLAVGLASGRREVGAALIAIAVAVPVSLAWDPAAGLLAGGLLGPLAGLALPLPEGAAAAPEVLLAFADPSAKHGTDRVRTRSADGEGAGRGDG
ncbi:MAG TPA: AzlC family ABC transporter permease [Candidatus Limnocylindrales bacterium]|jgi:4-azaleucine resistance transporter AzlC